MSDGDWSRNVTIAGLIALVLFAGYATFGHLRVKHEASVPSRSVTEQSHGCEEAANAQSGANDSSLPAPLGRQAQPEDTRQARDQSYYACEDLVAQRGMRQATDRLVEQGAFQLWLGAINLFLLFGTLFLSIRATIAATRAAEVAQKEMEHSLGPRLGVIFHDLNWDPLDEAPEKTNPFLMPAREGGPDKTAFHFHNYGEGPALITGLYVRHYWRDFADGFPPPIDVLNAQMIVIPEGAWAKKSADSQPFEVNPWIDIKDDPLPKTENRTWFFIGFVGYEGLPGVSYLTRFCFYYHKADRRFYPGPAAVDQQLNYNGTERLDAKWFERRRLEQLIRAQY